MLRFVILGLAASILVSATVDADGQSSYVIESKNFRIPSVGLSFNLPNEWTDLGNERVDTMNRLTSQSAPQEKARYVAGLQRDLSFTRRSGYPTYMLIQKFPSKVTARSLLGAFPKLRTQNSLEAAMGDPYLDEKLKMIVVASGGTGEDGPYYTRTYTLPTRTDLVNIYTYFKASAFTNVVPELETAWLWLKMEDSLKLPDRWVTDLRSLMRDRDAKAAAAARTNAPPRSGTIIFAGTEKTNTAAITKTNIAPAAPTGTNTDDLKTTPAAQTNNPPATPQPTNTPGPSSGDALKN
jgi:hypothetical protein